MKQSLRIFLLLLTAHAVALLVFGLLSLSDDHSHAQHRSALADNPQARADWEFERLRDPATGRIPDGIHRRELAYAATMPKRESRTALFRSAGVQEYSWSSHGPYNVGGRTRALALDIAGEDTILAGGVSGGMWRSSNAGASWQRTTSPFQLPAVSCITQDVRSGKTATWYYGSGEIVGNSAAGGGSTYRGDGIFKSVDNGRTWQQLSSTVSGTPQEYDRPTDYIWNIVTDPSRHDSDVVYAAAFGAIIRSADGGQSWSTVLTDPVAAFFTDVAITSTGVVYAAFSSESGVRGIWRSTNGTAWTQITPANWPAQYQRIVIGVVPSNPNAVFFLVHAPNSGSRGKNWAGQDVWISLWKYTFVSGDGTGSGGVWDDRSQNLPRFGSDFGDFDPQGSYDMAITVKPDDENAVFIAGTNIYRSTDAFTSPNNSAWMGGYLDVTYDLPDPIDKIYSWPNHHPDLHGIVFSRKNPRVVYTASDGGVHRSDNALADTVAWTSLNNGYLTTQFYTLAIDHGTPGSSMLIGGLQDQSTWLLTNGSGTTPWTMVGGDYDGSYCSVVDGGKTVYLSVQEGWAFRADVQPNGSVANYARVDPVGGSGYRFINPFIIDPSDQARMYLLAGTRIWRNSNLMDIPAGPNQATSINWKRFDKSAITSGYISAIEVSTAPIQHRVYFGTSNGKVYRLDDGDSGVDDPASVDITSTTFPANGYVSCIAVDPEDANRAMVVFSNYSIRSLFFTEDAGATWIDISRNLEENFDGSGAGPSCRWAEIMHRNGTTFYFVGTSAGLFSTTNLDGPPTTWLQEGATTIGNVVVDMIDSRASDGFVAIATHGNGIFTTTIVSNSVPDDKGVATATMQLRNYPNPVADATTISFYLPTATDIDLTLFDPSGRRVATLAYGPMDAGEHEVRVDVTKLPERLAGGVYYYRLGIEGKSETGEMVVLQ